MTEQEIIKAISQVDGIGGMTVNERLYVCGLMDEFDKAQITDKNKAKKTIGTLMGNMGLDGRLRLLKV